MDMKSILDKWTGPSAMLILLGGIVWGVQLNFAVLGLTEQLAEQTQRLQDTNEEIEGNAVLMARTAAVLDSLVRQVDALERRMTRNESWISNNREHKHSKIER